LSQPAITALSLLKRFSIPVEHASTLQQRFIHPIATSRHHELLAVNNVSFEVPRGQFLGIAGPNGCGKSTLLRMLAGIYKPDGGTLRVAGRVSPFLELGVGFKADLSARDNIVLGGTVLGLTKRQAAGRIDDVLDFAELAEFGDQKLRNFSSGMGVRLAFAVAALADADILLMDEVLAVGDAHFREKCFDVFWYYKRRGRTIVLVSHDLQALEQYCDRVIFMELGAIVADGPPAPVIRHYRQTIAEQNRDTPPAAAVGDARGKGAIEVLRVSLLDPKGRPRLSFQTGDTMTVAIEYRLQADLDEIVGGFVLNRGDGRTLAVADPRTASFDVGSGVAGTHRRLLFDLSELPFLDGTYTLSVGFLGKENAVLAQVDDALTFHVTDVLGRGGIVALKGGWRQETIHDPAKHTPGAQRLAST
jgi:ABC-type polysaccharide/polyol phosphate transport system ATPase subunit